MELLYDGFFDDVPEEIRAILPSRFAMMGMMGAVANLMEYGDLEPVVIIEYGGRTAVQQVPEWDERVSKWVPMVAAALNARLALGGGDHALLIIDTFQAKGVGDVEEQPPPSENPNAHEAVVVFEVRGRECLGCWSMGHGRDDEGETTIGPWQNMPTTMESQMMDCFQASLLIPIEAAKTGEELMRASYPDLGDGLLVQDS